MQIKTFEQLTARDERVGYFAPLGLMMDRVMKPEASVDFLQRMIADSDLCPAVPDSVREYFELARRLHTYGYFAYEFFTEAFFRALFALELALKVRFLETYNNQIPLVNGKTKESATLTVNSYADLDEALRPGGNYSKRKGWTLQDLPGFDGSMKSLIDWARKTSLLTGRRTNVVLDASRNLRNIGAHPTGTTVFMPPDSAHAINQTAAIINRLWGHEPLNGGSSESASKMSLFAIQWATDGASRTACPADELASIPENDRAGQWFLVEAADQEDRLLEWHPDYDLTAYPTRLVWSGDSWEAAVKAWMNYKNARQFREPVLHRDHIFLVRFDSSGYELPRSPAQFRGLPLHERDAAGSRWQLLRSDDPFGYVFLLMRDDPSALRLIEPPEGEVLGDCATWDEAVQRLLELGEVLGQAGATPLIWSST